MKLTGELKKKVDAAENRDEARNHIARAGMDLTDDELEQVVGGLAGNEPARDVPICISCGQPLVWAEFETDRTRCPHCGKPLPPDVGGPCEDPFDPGLHERFNWLG